MCMPSKRKAPRNPTRIELTVANIDEKVAALLGVQVKDIKIADMAVHPISKEIYLAVTRNGSPAQSVLVKCDHKGNLHAVALNDVSFYETSITDVPAPGTKLPQQWHTLTMAVTDMAFVDGELFVSDSQASNSVPRCGGLRFPLPISHKQYN